MNVSDKLEVYSSNNQANVWRNYSYDMTVGSDIAKYIARTKYAFPGGYELYAITDDGAVLCHNCCKTEFVNIKTAYPGDGWNVVAVQTTAWDESLVECDHCHNAIHIQCEACFEVYDTVAELHNHECEEYSKCHTALYN